MSSAAQHLLKTFPFKMFRATQCLLKPLPVANGYLISLPANFTTKTPLPYLSTPFKLHLSWSLSSLSPPPLFLKNKTLSSSGVTSDGQTSDSARPGEDNTVVIKEEELTWQNQEISGSYPHVSDWKSNGNSDGGGAKMTITAKPSITDSGLMVGSRVVCNRVAENLVVSPESSGSAFLGATSPAPSSRHVFNVGVLEGYRFICLFRAKFWWMIPRVGKSASEIPMETQMLLLEVREESALDDENSSDMTSESTFYVLFLPVLDGPFRTSLQGTSENVLQFCVESGDPSVQASQVLEAVLINSGDNPFELLKNSIKILEKRKGTFAHIEHKKAPPHLDWFGWCTWDAFYTEVNPQGIREGLQSFLEGGCPPKFLIIDDGWQETINEFHKGSKPHIDGTQFATRLVDIRENSKFKSSGSESSCIDLHDFIQTIKERYRLK